MDALAIHPYPENSTIPPTFAHPNSTPIGIADYSKLVGLLATAFDGTAQPGSTLPILYAEYGVETQIPANKASAYTGVEPETIKPVPETTQAAYYRQAMQIAFCQPNVVGLFIFHAFDEPALDRFQSGLYYSDGDAEVEPAGGQGRRAVCLRRRGGEVHGAAADADGTHRVSADQLDRARARPRSRSPATSTAIVYARLEKATTHTTTLAKRADRARRRADAVLFPARSIAPGQYRFTVRLTAPVNPGPPLTAASATLLLTR